MPRVFYNDGQEIVFEDLNAESSSIERELYERSFYEMLQRVDNAFFQTSFQVEYVGPVNLSVQPGLGYQTDNSQTGSEPKKRPIYTGSALSLTLSPPDTVHDRIDVICVKHNRVTSKTDDRNYKDPITLAISTQTFTVETDWSSDVQVIVGTPAITPSAPAVPSGYIKLAEVYVHAVAGLANQGDITDFRTLMPIGGEVLIDSSTYNRAPTSTSQSLKSILASFDNYLTKGLQIYTDFIDQGSNPAVPASGKYRLFSKSGVLYTISNGGLVTPIGSGAGGGGGANWHAAPGSAPLQSTENGELVWLFTQDGAGEELLTLFLRVPSSYISGRQILMYLGQYSPSSSGTQLLNTTTYLVRQNLDPMTTVANSFASTNAAMTNTVANQYRQTSYPLCNSVGVINSFNVSPGDLLKVVLARQTDTDTADIRFIPSATEVKFNA